MKTPAIPHEKKSPVTPVAKAASSTSKKKLKRSTAKVAAPKAEAMAKPIGLLPERVPSRDEGRICFALYAPGAQAVFVAGTFNDWQPSATPLQRQADGRWAVELIIGPGRHEYRFVVDGQWMDDPLSPAYVSNPFGGLNCVPVMAIRG